MVNICRCTKNEKEKKDNIYNLITDRLSIEEIIYVVGSLKFNDRVETKERVHQHYDPDWKLKYQKTQMDFEIADEDNPLVLKK